MGETDYLRGETVEVSSLPSATPQPATKHITAHPEDDKMASTSNTEAVTGTTDITADPEENKVASMGSTSLSATREPSSSADDTAVGAPLAISVDTRTRDSDATAV